MHVYPKPILDIIEALQALPAVGPKTAERYALTLKEWPKARLQKLSENINALSSQLATCEICFSTMTAPAKGTPHYCDICKSKGRTQKQLCVVERESDIATFEKIGLYRGRYFILGGLLSPTRKNVLVSKRLKILKDRLANDSTLGQEIIIALNPTPLGDATAQYLQRLLQPLRRKITRLGRGLPMGSDVGYADEQTLASAFNHRQAV